MPIHMMPIDSFFGPPRFGIEFAYTVIVVLLCFLVYYKTRNIYDLTQYKGIKFFRYAFLFFGLAYASRLFLHFLLVGNITFDLDLSRWIIMPFSSLIVAYFSTMAIFYLVYSTIWKRIKYSHFMAFSNIIALSIALIAFISRSPIMVSLIQLILLVFAVVVSFEMHKKVKKISHIRLLYLLILVFWLLNLFVLGPSRFLPFEIKLFFQAISIIVFILIYYRVSKWVK
ncbi:MAG: hypothetical protein V1859_03715 [archaeon]